MTLFRMSAGHCDGSAAPEWPSIQTTKSGVQIRTPPQIKKMDPLTLPSCEPSA